MEDLKQELLKLQSVRELIGEAAYKLREEALLNQHIGGSGNGTPPGKTQQGGSTLDLGAAAGQAIFIGPPNRQYRIERSLGKGSFGEVFLAEDVETTQQLGSVTWRAVKVLHKSLAADKLSRKRLTQEAMQVQQLRHKHIVAVYDWSIDPVQDTPFLVMEYLKGRALSGVLADRLGSGGYTLTEALELLRPVAQALDYAWGEHKLVHRDLKPDNLFITEPGGVIKLLDFGLAARMRSTASNAGIAVPERAGTQDYAPPEAAAKQKAWHPSHDVYSLAVVLYQLLDPEHELPFQQRAPGTPWPARPEGLSDAQWEVLKQGLAYRQEERISSAGAFLDALYGAQDWAAERKEAEGKEQEAARVSADEGRRAQQEAQAQQEQARRAAEEAKPQDPASRNAPPVQLASAAVAIGKKVRVGLVVAIVVVVGFLLMSVRGKKEEPRDASGPESAPVVSVPPATLQAPTPLAKEPMPEQKPQSAPVVSAPPATPQAPTSRAREPAPVPNPQSAPVASVPPVTLQGPTPLAKKPTPVQNLQPAVVNNQPHSAGVRITQDDFAFEIGSCQRSGDRLSCVGSITNTYSSNRNFRMSAQLIDSQGAEYSVTSLNIGISSSSGGSVVQASLEPNLPVNLAIDARGAASAISTASLVLRYGAEGSDGRGTVSSDAKVLLRNVPVIGTKAADDIKSGGGALADAAPSVPNVSNPPLSIGVRATQDDFMFEIKSCRRSGDRLSCAGSITNTYSGSRIFRMGAQLIDNQGTEYSVTSLSIGNTSTRGFVVQASLEPNLPVKFTIDARGAASTASSASLVLKYGAQGSNARGGQGTVSSNTKVVLRNVPVTGANAVDDTGGVVSGDELPQPQRALSGDRRPQPQRTFSGERRPQPRALSGDELPQTAPAARGAR